MYKKKKKNVKKFRKKFNTKIIKAKLSYSVKEIAELLNVCTNTVGAWFKDGLKKIDAQQPYLVFGQDLIDFLKARINSKKCPCAINEFFCCKCQKPRRPKNNVVYFKISEARSNVIGLCEVCGTKINKAISPHKIDLFKKTFDTQVIHEEDLIECAKTCAIVKENIEEKNDKI